MDNSSPTPIEGQLAGTISISQTFPELPVPLVARHTQSGILEELMSFSFDAVVLDGDDDSGKTTALAQFAIEHQSHVVSLFLRPITEFTYEPARIRFELSNQIHWLLFGKQLDQDAACDGGTLRELYGRLERRANRDKRPIYFVVDGIADIPSEAASVKQAILTMLPIGVPAFRFLLSGSEAGTGIANLPKKTVRPQIVLPFTLEEAVELFDGTATRAQVEEIHKTFRGRVGALASVRRLLNNGVKAETLLETFPDTIKEIFSLEWGRIELDDSLTQMLLAIAAFAPEVGSIPNLTCILGINESDLRQKLSSVSCIRIDPKTGEIRYVSESFRKYATTRLGDRRKSVLEQVVAFLQSEGGKSNAFHSLPEYLEQIGDINGLVSFLNTQTTAGELGKSKSIAMIIERLGRASRLALKHKKGEASVRLIAQRTVLRGVLNRHGRTNHIKAALTIKGEASALALATQAFANEERLHMLAVIARSHRIGGVKIDPQLESEISRLADSTDWAELRDKALEIASELMAVFPDIATKIIERSVGGTTNPHSLDVAVASAYIRAAARSDARGYRTQLLDQALKATNAKGRKSLLVATAGLAPAESVDELFSDLQRIQQTSEIAFLLRLWLDKHQDGPDSVRVAQKLLDTMLADAKFTPAPRLYQAAIGAVAHGNCDRDSGLRILNIVEAQLPTLKAVGPMADYIRLLCEVTVARYKLAVAEPFALLVEESLALDGYPDASVRATAFAWLKSTCRRMELGVGVADEWGLVRYADQGLTTAVDLILVSTAEQSAALSAIVKPLALEFLSDLEVVIARTNTSSRRDELIEATVHQLVSGTSKDLDSRLENGARLVAQIESPPLRDEVVGQLVEWVAKNSPKFAMPVKAIETACGIVEHVASPADRARMYAACYSALPDLDRASNQGQRLMEMVEAECGRIDRTAIRIDTSFKLATTLSSKSREMAQRYFDQGSQLASSALGKVAASGRSLRQALMLAARALAALERANSATPLDVERFGDAVVGLPSKTDQANIWNFFALSLARSRKQRALEVVETRLKPTLRELLSDNRAMSLELQGAIVRAAPSLWLHHSATIGEFLGRLAPSTRDYAASQIIDHLICGEIPGEPWKQSDRQNTGFTYETASDVLGLLEGMQTDSTISAGITTLLDAMRDSSVESRVNRAQRIEILRKVREIVRTKLPEPVRGIRHEGYAVLAEAEVMATERAVDFEQWQAIIARVEAIPNAADVAYLLAALVELMPRKHASLRREVFERARESIEKLTLIEDRMDRAHVLVEKSQNHFHAECNSLVSKVLMQSLNADRPSLQDRRAAFLDLLNRLDPVAAQAFSSVTEADPVRRRALVALQSDLKEIQIAQKVRDANSIAEEDQGSSSLSDACWSELGNLNNSRSTTRKYSDNIELIANANDFPIDLAYSIFAFAIEATAVGYERTPQAAEYLRPLYLAAIESWELATVATTISDGQAFRDKGKKREEVSLTSLHVSSGMRETAINRLCDWIASSKSTSLKVVDPYFRAADLKDLFRFAEMVPHADVTLVTSMFATKPGQGTTRREEFEASWREHAGKMSQTYCQVVIVGVPSTGLFGVHNRWLILDDLGIDLGTSISAIGGARSHTIMHIDHLTISKCSAEIDEYAAMQRKYFQEERLKYECFSLPPEP